MTADRIAARFSLRTRCLNCRKDTVVQIEVPCADDAPTAVDELLESAFLQSQRFTCARCESQIAVVTAVSKLREAEDA